MLRDGRNVLNLTCSTPLKRFTKDLSKLLRSLQDSIRKHTDAIRENTEATKSSDSPKPELQVKSEVSLPVAVTDYYASENSDRQGKQRWEWIRRIFESVALVTALALAFFTYKTLRQVERQADGAQAQVGIMRLQLESYDRPWIRIIAAGASHPMIFHKSGQSLNVAGTDTVNVGLQLAVKNVGRSVALDTGAKSKLIFPDFEGHGKSNMFNWPMEQQKLLCSDTSSSTELPFNLFPDEDSGDRLGNDTDSPVPSLGSGTFVIDGKNYIAPRLCWLRILQDSIFRYDSSDGIHLFYSGRQSARCSAPRGTSFDRKKHTT